MMARLPDSRRCLAALVVLLALLAPASVADAQRQIEPGETPRRPTELERSARPLVRSRSQQRIASGLSVDTSNRSAVVTSLSLNSAPGANYASANITMTGPGGPVALTVVSRTDNGFGDNTIVWEPTGLSLGPGMADTTYSVTVSSIQSAATTSVSYDVTVIDPALPATGIFSDGFESGDWSQWSDVTP